MTDPSRSRSPERDAPFRPLIVALLVSILLHLAFALVLVRYHPPHAEIAPEHIERVTVMTLVRPPKPPLPPPPRSTPPPIVHPAVPKLASPPHAARLPIVHIAPVPHPVSASHLSLSPPHVERPSEVASSAPLHAPAGSSGTTASSDTHSGGAAGNGASSLGGTSTGGTGVGASGSAPAGPNCAHPDQPATIVGDPPQPNEPEDANGATGMAKIRVDLAASGAVLDVAVVVSSGSPALDQEALRVAKIAQYAPEHRGCLAVAGSYLFRAEFQGQ